MITTRVKIGKIQATGDSAQGLYWGFDQKSNATFFGTVGQVRQQFRATQSSQANIQFSDDGTDVFLIVPKALNIGLFNANVGISLVGGGVTMWAAEGGFVATAPSGFGLTLPAYTEVDSVFNNNASIAVTNTGDISQFFAVPPLLNGTNVFAVEVVASTATAGGPIYDVGNVTISPSAPLGLVQASLDRTVLQAAIPARDGFAHTVLFTGDGTTLSLYFDGRLMASAAQVGGVIATVSGKFGHAVSGGGTGYTGKIAQVSIGNQAVNQQQAGASATANTQKYVPRH